MIVGQTSTADPLARRSKAGNCTVTGPTSRYRSGGQPGIGSRSEPGRDPVTLVRPAYRPRKCILDKGRSIDALVDPTDLGASERQGVAGYDRFTHFYNQHRSRGALGWHSPMVRRGVLHLRSQPTSRYESTAFPIASASVITNGG